MKSENKLQKVYLGLALYFVAVGIFGWFRTGSVIPFAITAGAGVITALLGIRLESGSSFTRNLALGWFFSFAAASLYSAFGRISAHTSARPEAVYIFLSLAVSCGIAIVYTLRNFTELLQDDS